MRSDIRGRLQEPEVNEGNGHENELDVSFRFMKFFRDVAEQNIPLHETGGLERTPEELNKELSDIRKDIKELLGVKKEIAELRSLVLKPTTLEPTKGDEIYLTFKDELEKGHMGEVVAIDIESRTIAGIGDTVTEAYGKAKAKTGRTRFAFKRVGKPYLHAI